MSIPYTFSDNSVSFFSGGKPYSVVGNREQLAPILDELRKPTPDEEYLVRIASPIQAAIADVERGCADGSIEPGRAGVTNEHITWNGEVIDNALTRKMLELLRDGWNIMPWVRFMENVFQNPADFARDELYLWLAKASLPITEDGHILAYKKIRNNYTDIYTGTINNMPGQIVTMDRAEVDPVRDRTCSYGLHFCSQDYLPRFGVRDGNRVVVLKINPADIVSIPSDYDNTKGRCCRYEVIGEIEVEGVTDKQWGAVYSNAQAAEDAGDLAARFEAIAADAATEAEQQLFGAAAALLRNR